MVEAYRNLSMAEHEAREAGRYIAHFVPENRIQTAASIPEALLKADIAQRHIRNKQGPRTTQLEQYFEDKLKEKEIVERLGEIGAGTIDVLAYHLNGIEKGAGEYAASLAHSLTTNSRKELSSTGGVQRALEEETLKTLHERAGSIVRHLKSTMRPAAIERKLETYEKMGNPFERYKVEGRNESIKDFLDSRSAFMTEGDVGRILQDLTSEGKRRLVSGYNHLVDLFNGTPVGVQERRYLDSEYGN